MLIVKFMNSGIILITEVSFQKCTTIQNEARSIREFEQRASNNGAMFLTGPLSQ